MVRNEADEIGFLGVMSGPLVRSSYRAGRLYQQAVEQREAAGEPVAHHTGQRMALID